MGKPMGNGFPVSAVWTKSAIASVLGHGVEYFNTVFVIILVVTYWFVCNYSAVWWQSGIMCSRSVRHACYQDWEVTSECTHCWSTLSQTHSWIANTSSVYWRRSVCVFIEFLSFAFLSGVGLFIGIDLVVDRKTREPATQLAADAMLKLRQEYGFVVFDDNWCCVYSKLQHSIEFGGTVCKYCENQTAYVFHSGQCWWSCQCHGYCICAIGEEIRVHSLLLSLLACAFTRNLFYFC
jgi:hypothetical protein